MGGKVGMMAGVLSGILALGLVLGTGGCGRGVADAEGEEEPAAAAAGEENAAAGEKKEEPPLVVLGEVVSVYGADKFALIRKYGGGPLPVGYGLMAVSRSGRSVNLTPTGERIGRFHAVDLREGQPEPGDTVMARRMPDSGLEVSPEGPPRGGN